MPPRPFPRLAHPVVQAPMAGGPGGVALATAVCSAGGLGFLAGGYRSVEQLRDDLAALRTAVGAAAFGVNLFLPAHRAGDPDAVAAYARELAGEEQRAGVALGRARADDDGYAAKLALLRTDPPPVVSFTFGCPPAGDVERLQQAGAAVWATVTAPAEAAAAAATGVDALVVQGLEAGGHRGSFDDAEPNDYGLLALLQLVRAHVGPTLPLVAAGGIATGAGVAAVLAAGASAAAVGTGFLLCAQAGTAPLHRRALLDASGPTVPTRAFTGRLARAVPNRFVREHGGAAPSAYPQVHQLTAPLRAAARARGDAESLHLWAGQGYPLAAEGDAASLVRRLGEQARAALQAAASAWPAGSG